MKRLRQKIEHLLEGDLDTLFPAMKVRHTTQHGLPCLTAPPRPLTAPRHRLTALPAAEPMISHGLNSGHQHIFLACWSRELTSVHARCPSVLPPTPCCRTTAVLLPYYCSLYQRFHLHDYGAAVSFPVFAHAVHATGLGLQPSFIQRLYDFFEVHLGCIRLD